MSEMVGRQGNPTINNETTNQCFIFLENKMQ
jgi:hypothetical protein